MPIDRAQYHYSVTVFIERREVLYAVRGLSVAAQREVNNRIPWAAATDEVWKTSRRVVKFHFTSQDTRAQFMAWMTELVKSGTWDVIGQSENDPAPDPD